MGSILEGVGGAIGRGGRLRIAGVAGAVAIAVALLLAPGARANVLEGEAGYCVGSSHGSYGDNACTLPTAPGAGGWEWVAASGSKINGTKFGKRNLILSDDSAGEVECTGSSGTLIFSGATGLSVELGFSGCLEGERGCGTGASLRHGGSIHPTLAGTLEETATHEVRFTVPSFELEFECIPERTEFFIHADPSSNGIGEANQPIPSTGFNHLKILAHTHESEGASEVLFKPQLEFTEKAFEFRTHVPAVTALAPDSGEAGGGTAVTVTGLNFEEVTGVSFGSTPASAYTVESPTRITATAPAGTGEANVIVTNAAGASAAAAVNEFSYAPVVQTVTPAQGPATGGTAVTITGEKLDEATGVKFGEDAAASWEIVAPEEIRAVSPAGSPAGFSGVDVRIESPDGTSAARPSDLFEYLAVARVEKVSPNKGPTSGGTTVLIEGWGFRDVEEVWFGSVPASSVTVLGFGRIEAVAPPNTAATVPVLVTTGGGTSAPAAKRDIFKYGKPEVTRVAPAAAPLAGGTVVTVEGAGFAPGGGTTILFKKTPGTAVSCESTSVCTVTAPAVSKLGTVDVIAVVGKGKSRKSPADHFSYE